MRLFAGVDGGQSSTQAVVGDETGRILGRGAGGPADEVGQTPESTRMRDAIDEALRNAREHAGLEPDVRFDTVVAGISGYNGTVRGVDPTVAATRFVLMHDAPVAHAGALDGAPGVVVVAGTGSVAYSVGGDARVATVGGWGYLFGDEGSAFWIVRSAITNAIAHAACNGIARLCAYFAQPTLHDVAQAFYSGAISRKRLASFAQSCIDAARDEPRACACITQPVSVAPVELARLARAAAPADLDPCSIAFVGGLVRDPWFRASVHAATRAAFELAPARGCRIVEPVHDPAIGALILAYKTVFDRAPEVRSA